MNIVNLFPQAVLETQLENWDQCREEIFKQVELSSGDIEFSNDIVLASNSFISTNILKKCPITTAQLNANLQQYADTIGVESLKICVQDSPIFRVYVCYLHLLLILKLFLNLR